MTDAAKAKELDDQVTEAIDRGAVPLHRGTPADARFLTGEDTSAYAQPVTLLHPRRSSPPHHANRSARSTRSSWSTRRRSVAAMNASNGALVAILSADERATLDRLDPHIRAFEIGHGVPRSRCDRDELSGGFGASWRGALVGGELLVRAVTRGPAGERLPGNFPDHRLTP